MTRSAMCGIMGEVGLDGYTMEEIPVSLRNEKDFARINHASIHHVVFTNNAFHPEPGVKVHFLMLYPL